MSFSLRRGNDGRPKMSRWADGLAFSGLALLVIWNALNEHAVWRSAVRVRSCGGNFEMLSDFSRAFERKHRCRVHYVAAPIQFLLELALEDERHLPDVLVGRGGPGWQVLEQRGKLDGSATYYAVDPIVIATPRGNPASIRSIQDLGRDGVRVASAPWAMRPKGKVFGHLMARVSARFHPGLVDRWERNTLVRERCGRLIGRAVARGKVDAAIVPLSLTSQKPLAGHCEIVEIPVKYLDTLSMGRGSLPQMAARTTARPENRLAEAYMEELTGEAASALLVAHGYVPKASPRYAEFETFLKPFDPKPMPPRQMKLAALLRRDGATKAVVRRYLKVIHTFGPCREAAEAWYRIDQHLKGQGQPRAARLAWNHLIETFPTGGHKEWIRTIHAVRDRLGDPETEWVERARQSLRSLSGSAVAVVDAPIVFAPIRVRQGDPSKGATRDLALAVDLYRLGFYDFAVRDALKVVTLHYPSPHRPPARAVAGAALYAMGKRRLAAFQWRRVVEEHADSPWAGRCAAALSESTSGPIPQESSSHPGRYATHAERGLSYAYELQEAGSPLYALKECFKMLVGLYGPCDHAAEARFLAGDCLARMRRYADASQQWLRCGKTPEGERWASSVRSAIERYKFPSVSDADERRQRYEIPAAFPASKSAGKKLGIHAKTPPAVKRLRLGEELLAAGITDDDQALQEFLKVLTVVPCPPAFRWTRTVAHVRAGQALLLSGRFDRARRHLNQAAQAEGPSEAIAQANRLLSGLRESSEAQP